MYLSNEQSALNKARLLGLDAEQGSLWAELTECQVLKDARWMWWF